MVNPINQTLYNFVERRILKKAPIAKLFVWDFYDSVFELHFDCLSQSGFRFRSKPDCGPIFFRSQLFLQGFRLASHVFTAIDEPFVDEGWLWDATYACYACFFTFVELSGFLSTQKFCPFLWHSKTAIRVTNTPYGLAAYWPPTIDVITFTYISNCAFILVADGHSDCCER